MSKASDFAAAVRGASREIGKPAIGPYVFGVNDAGDLVMGHLDATGRVLQSVSATPTSALALAHWITTVFGEATPEPKATHP